MAALTAARAGARVILVDDAPAPGGSLLASTATIEGADPIEFVSGVGEELASCPNVRVLRRTTAFGYYDDNMIVAVERRADHLPAPSRALRAPSGVVDSGPKEVVLATGAIERPLPFEDNDLPGVMLASAARTYAFQHGVRLGDRAVMFTNNDSAYEAIEPMLNAGTNVVAVVDARDGGPGGDALAVVRALRNRARRRQRGDARDRPHRRRWGGDSFALGGRRIGGGRFPAHARAISSASRAAGTRPSTCSRNRRAGCGSTPNARRSCRGERAARTLGRGRARTPRPRRMPRRRNRGRHRCRLRRGIRRGARARPVRPCRSGATAPRCGRSGRCRCRRGATASASSTSRTT